MADPTDGVFDTTDEEPAEAGASNTIDMGLDLDPSATLSVGLPTGGTAHPGDTTHSGASRETTQPDHDQLGRYKRLGLLGSGGMGEVWRVWDPALRREVALKVMRSQSKAAPRRLARFVAEAQATAQLQHPGVVPVYDSGELPDGRPYYTMKVIEGRTLTELVEALHKDTSPERWGRTDDGKGLLDILGILHAVCEALAYAHERRAVHRDIKPANILVGHFGEVLLVDWGLVKIVGESIDSIDSGFVETDQSVRPELATRFGAVAGTPGFMPPEQEDGRVDRIGPASDVYALGAVLFYILSGDIPRAPERVATILQGLPRVDPELRRLCLDTMQPEAALRPAHAGKVAERLGAWLQGARAEARAAASVRQAEDALRRLSPEDQRWFRIWCMRIIDPERRVRPVLVDRDRHPELSRLLATPVFSHDGSGVSFTDASLPASWTRLGTWMDEHAEQHRTIHAVSSAAREWERAGRSRRLLWTDRDVVLRSQPTAELLGAPADAFMAASRADLQQKGRRRGLLTAGIIALLASSTALSLVQWQRAVEAQRDESAARLEAEAQSFQQQAHRRLAEQSPHAAVALFAAAEALQPGGLHEAGQQAIAAHEPIHFYAGHSGDIKATAWSPDGRRVASGSSDQTVQIWSPQTGERLQTLPHPDGIRKVVWSPDGRYLATCTLAGELRTWEAATGRLLHQLPNDNPWVSALRFLRSGRLLAGEPSGLLRIYDPVTGTATRTLRGHEHYVFASDESPDGRWLATASVDQTVRVWDLLDGTEHQTLPHPVQLLHVAISPDGTRVAAGGVEDARVWLWDAQSGEQVSILNAQRAAVAGIDISPDSQQVVTAGRRSALDLWSATTGAHLRSTASFAGDAAIDVRFSPDGTEVAVSTTAESVVWLDADTGAISARHIGDGASMRTLQWAPDGSAVLTGQMNGRVAVHRRTRAPVAASQPCGQGKLRDAELSPNGRLLALAFHVDGLCVIDTDTGETTTVTDLGVRDLSWGSESRLLGASVKPSPNERILVWDHSTGHLTHHLDGESVVSSVHLSRDSRSVWTAARSHELLAASLTTGETVARLPLPRKPLSTWFGQDHVLTLYHDRTADIWRLHDGERVARDPRASAEPRARGLDPMGHYAVWESEPGTLSRIPLDDRDAWHIPIDYEPKDITIDQSGRWVVVIDGDRVLRVYAGHSGLLLGELSMRAIGSQVEFSPSGERMLVLTDMARVHVYQVRDMRLLQVVALEDRAAIQFATFRQEDRIITFSEDLIARTWAIPESPMQPGALSNLRPCRDGALVAVTPWPGVGAVWAPEAECGDGVR